MTNDLPFSSQISGRFVFVAGKKYGEEKRRRVSLYPHLFACIFTTHVKRDKKNHFLEFLPTLAVCRP